MSREKWFLARARASVRDLPWIDEENSENFDESPTLALTAKCYC